MSNKKDPAMFMLTPDERAVWHATYAAAIASNMRSGWIESKDSKILDAVDAADIAVHMLRNSFRGGKGSNFNIVVDTYLPGDK